jgi:hypothetical protein
MSAIQIILAKSRLSRWHRRLVEDLRRDGHGVGVDLRDGAPEVPAALALVEQLERLLVQRGRPGESDSIAVEEWTAGAIGAPNVVFDLTGASEPAAGAIAPRYDGRAGDLARDAVLLQGSAPVVMLADARDGQLNVFSQALPGIERRPNLLHGRIAVARCTAAMIRALVAEGGTAFPRRPPSSPAPPSRPVAYFAGLVATRARARLYRLLAHEGHWRVAWRSVARAPTVWEQLNWPPGNPWRWLQDDRRRYFADPFPYRVGGTTHVFCEEYPYATQKGVISTFALDAEGRAGAPRVVLERPYHLSYPVIFEHAGQIWMMPESSANHSLELYRADPFPDRWVFDRTLLTGVSIADATPFESGGRWWLAGTTWDLEGSSWDCLSLFSGDSIAGPWTPSGARPVLVDASSARPAGRIVSRNGALWRPAQDCTRGYGSTLALCRIDRVDEGVLSQTVAARLRPPPGAPSEGVHTLNVDSSFELIDAVGWRSRSGWLDKEGAE